MLKIKWDKKFKKSSNIWHKRQMTGYVGSVPIATIYASTRPENKVTVYYLHILWGNSPEINDIASISLNKSKAKCKKWLEEFSDATGLK